MAAPSRIFRFGEYVGAVAALGPALFVVSACGGRSQLEVGTVVADAANGDGAPDAMTTPGGQPAIGTATAPDCPGCSFPSQTAAPCANAPPIKIVYPPDAALLPPNLNAMSVQWVPYGAPFARFEVDFSQSAQAPLTDWRIVTACSAQTTDVQGATSGGCEVTVDPSSWRQLAAANRGGNAIAITVRGTTDGACASTSADTVHVSIAEEDLLGTYFYWKSYTTPLGTGGQVWAKTFGDITTAEQNVTSAPFQGPLCAGCHFPARDGSRMLAYPVDDTDADYGGLGGAYLDMTPSPANPPIEVTGRDGGVSGGQPPGMTALAPTAAYYITSNGLPCTTAGAPCEESDGYSAAVGTNAFSLWDGQTGKFTGAVTIGDPGTRPTMPDWSIDGTSIVYVQPAALGSWDGARRHDDDHIFGGSLYSAPYTGGGTFGRPASLVASQGENNYYPSYSPDVPASFVLFDRAPLDMSVATLTGCNGVIPAATCPNDSFSNPAARLMLVDNAPRAVPLDLENANGRPGVKASLSNSYPRWAPFVQTYKGKRLFWITFSSTRDYGLRLLNHKDGMYPCYPPDSLEWPGSSHHNVISSLCQQPQLWMAPLLVAGAQAGPNDPSGVAFWVPYQDITTHNHMAQWTWRPQPGPTDGRAAPCSCSTSGGPCGPANGGCGCCSGQTIVCSGDGQCIQPAQ